MSKKKLVCLILFGSALPLILTAIGLPNYLVITISLGVSCCVDGIVIYKIAKWLKPKLLSLYKTSSIESI